MDYLTTEDLDDIQSVIAGTLTDSGRIDCVSDFMIEGDSVLVTYRLDGQPYRARIMGAELWAERVAEDRSDSIEDAFYRLDADEEKDVADALVEAAEKKLMPAVNQWIKQIKSYLEASPGAKGGGLADGTVYQQLNDNRFASPIEQALLLAHLAGMDEATDDPVFDSLIRMDAPRPEWLRLPFKEAIAAFRKKLAIPTASYRKMAEGYHDWAFSISKMTKASLLKDAKWVIERGLEDGTGYDDLIKQWNKLIGRQGWRAGDSRIYTILDTNIRSAQTSGRAQQMYDPDLIDRRPYAIWRWRDSVQPRPNHRALHNTAIALKDPFWDKVRVPGGFGCKCSIMSASKDFCDRNGIKILDNPPSPETIADPGFRYPLKGLGDKDRQDVIKRTLESLPASLQKVVEADING